MVESFLDFVVAGAGRVDGVDCLNVVELLLPGFLDGQIKIRALRIILNLELFHHARLICHILPISVDHRLEWLLATPIQELGTEDPLTSSVSLKLRAR